MHSWLRIQWPLIHFRALLCVAMSLSAMSCKKPPHHEREIGFLHGRPRPGYVPMEERLEMTTVPVLEHDRYSHSFSVAISGKTPESIFSETSLPPWFADLIPGEPVRIVILEQIRMDDYTDLGEEIYSTNWELEQVWRGDECLYDASICPLHQIPMKRVLAPIHYGTPSIECIHAYASFSGGPGFTTGGCCGDPFQTEAFTYECPKCVAAYGKWKDSRVLKDSRKIQE
jgi:hypothetical protein